MADEATQLRKGVLELAALAMLAPAPMYGAQIISALAEIEGLAANSGTVYPHADAAGPHGPSRGYVGALRARRPSAQVLQHHGKRAESPSRTNRSVANFGHGHELDTRRR